MVTVNFGASGLEGPMIEVVIPVVVEENVVGYVPPQEGRQLEAELVPVLLALMIRTSLPGLVMRKCSSFHKNNTISALLRRDGETTARIQGPKDIPLNSSDNTVELIAIVHSIYC